MKNILQDKDFMNYIDTIFEQSIEQKVIEHCGQSQETIRYQAIIQIEDTIENELYARFGIEDEQETKQILEEIRDYLDNFYIDFASYDSWDEALQVL